MERKTHNDSWLGIESVKERFEIRNDKVVDYVKGTYTLEEALADYEEQGKTLSEGARKKYRELFL